MKDVHWALPGWCRCARELKPETKGTPGASLGAGVKPEVMRAQRPDGAPIWERKRPGGEETGSSQDSRGQGIVASLDSGPSGLRI